MRERIDERIPRYPDLINATFIALKELGGSGKNEEILNQIINDMNIPDEVVDIPHKGNPNKTELSYQADWARTYLRIYGAIENSARSVWSITKSFSHYDDVDGKIVKKTVEQINKDNRLKRNSGEFNPNDDDPDNDDVTFYDEYKPWRDELSVILQEMNPFAFERLAQRLLREMGFSDVHVTQKSNDKGIDGYGKLKLNGAFSFNVAFQCKRYKDVVGAAEIRDFRGSLSANIEKGIFITTGTFTKAAKEEAYDVGKQKVIDLIDGEDLIDKLEEYGLGLEPVPFYKVDNDFFNSI